MQEMPLYQCHKRVRALKIKRIAKTSNGLELHFEESGFGPQQASVEWVHRHAAEEGGYLVAYDDHYVSFSPRKAFEEGYTRVRPDLIEIANANPGCVAVPEPKGWTLYRTHPKDAPDDAEETWLTQNKLASGTDLAELAAAGIALEVGSI